MEVVFEVVEWVVMVYGGMGYVKEYYVEWYCREVMFFWFVFVSWEMIFNYIGERVLGLFWFY